MIYPTASFLLAQAETRLAAERVGAGPPVLLLHAGGETRAVWRRVMQTLAKRGYLAEAYDQRGHGESGGSPEDGVLGETQPHQAFGYNGAVQRRPGRWSCRHRPLRSQIGPGIFLTAGSEY